MTSQERKVIVTTESVWGTADFVVWQRHGETIEAAFHRQFKGEASKTGFRITAKKTS